MGACGIRTLHARAFGVTPDALAYATTEFVLCSTCGWHNQSLSFYYVAFRITGVKPYKMGPAIHDILIIYTRKEIIQVLLSKKTTITS
jgi:hypothetical protein